MSAVTSEKSERSEISPATATLNSLNSLNSQGDSVDLLAIASAAFAPPDTQTVSECWLLHFTDREPVEGHFAPPQSHDQVLTEWYPEAVAAAPIP